MDGGGSLVTTASYDNAGALADISRIPDSTPEVTYHYDRLGHQASIVCNGMTTTKAYTLGGMPLSESYSSGTLGGLAITNGYDQFLRRTNLVALNSGSALTWQSYGYDNASRLSLVTDNTGGTPYSAGYSYIANSPLVSQIIFKQGTTTRMTTSKSYDYLNRLTSIGSVASGGTNSFAYSYNSANQRTGVTNADSSKWVYGYDSLGQVTSGKKYWNDGTAVAGQQFGYTFDDIGNRTQTQAGGDQNGANLRTAYYTANNLNQYTSRTVPNAVDSIGLATNKATVTVNDHRAYRKGSYFWDQLGVTNSSAAVWMSVTNRAVLNNGSSSDIMATSVGNVFVPQTPEQFGYDLDGNLVWDGNWNYIWDAENRLIAMWSHTNIGPQISLKFEYDAMGRRIRKQVWGNTNWTGTAATDLRFAYDGWNMASTLNSSLSLLNFCMWGMDLSGSIQGAGGIGGLVGDGLRRLWHDQLFCCL